jgi:hypothetical protein
VSVNDVARSAATGVPIVGGALNKLDAATNAALAPVLNRFFAPENQLRKRRFGTLRAFAARPGRRRQAKFATDHPVIDTGAKLAGGVASMVPVMAAAPAAFGLAGPMSTMIRNGALSGAALSGADALVRGEIRRHRGRHRRRCRRRGRAGRQGRRQGGFRDCRSGAACLPVPQNLARVGNVDIPLSAAEVTQNPATLSAEQQILLRGGRGVPAQQNAQGFKDLQDARVTRRATKSAPGSIRPARARDRAARCGGKDRLGIDRAGTGAASGASWRATSAKCRRHKTRPIWRARRRAVAGGGAWRCGGKPLRTAGGGA